MTRKIFNKFIFIIFLITNLNQNVVKAVEYTDIENHWASDDIISLSKNNVLNGYSDNTFKPDANISTAEFLKILIEAGNYKLIRSGDSFWPDFYIETAKENGLLDEVIITDYDSSITRNQVVEILANFMDLSSVKKSAVKLKDLDDEHKEVVQKLIKLGVINGYSDKTFRGTSYITRGEVAAIIKRTLENKIKIDSNKKYNIEERIDLSNYGTSYEGTGVFSKTRYKLNDNKLLIYDSGKYSSVQNYMISDEIIDVSKVCNIIQKLISENTYTAVIYQPSEYTIDQLKILYGESEELINNNGADFTLTYYEDKLYELGRISMNEKFSNECYLKIEVIKLWKDFSEYEEGKYIDEYKKEKLLDVLQTEFGTSIAEKMLNYMINKNKLYVSNINKDVEQYEQRKFGKYVVDFYQKEHGVPQFYISKNN